MSAVAAEMTFKIEEQWKEKATDTAEFKVMRRLNTGLGEELVNKYFSNRSRETRRLLADHFALCIQLAARRVYRTLSRSQRREVSLEEVEQISHLLFHTVIDRFEPDRTVPLTAFLHVVLPRAIIDELRRLRVCSQGPRKVKFVNVAPSDDNSRFGVFDSADSSLCPAQQFENRQFRKSVLRTLPEELRLYAAHRYLRRQSVAYASKKAGIGRDKAFEMQKEIANRLADSLGCGALKAAA